MPRASIYLVVGAVARCAHHGCEWKHVTAGAPDVTRREMAAFNNTANAHAKRQRHDVLITIQRIYPGSLTREKRAAYRKAAK